MMSKKELENQLSQLTIELNNIQSEIDFIEEYLISSTAPADTEIEELKSLRIKRAQVQMQSNDIYNELCIINDTLAK